MIILGVLELYKLNAVLKEKCGKIGTHMVSA